MENLRYHYPATRPVLHRAHVGVVGSGDLEILLSPSETQRAEVVIRTSVDGYEHVWKSVLDRFFSRYDGAARLELNDFGATPGVVMLRLAEAVEASEGGCAVNAHDTFIARHSFIELTARERARALLDPGTFRELIGPFDRLESPWLAMQNVVCQADDGAVIARGTLGGEAAVIAAIEPAFQGGSIGEVSGTKIAAALELALREFEAGRSIRPVVLFETGGVRLQEANLGLAVIAEIHAAIVALQRYVPVVGVIGGMVGCFGGMSLAAALCNRLVMTRQARLGMNGPEVIEEEAGVEELDSRDRRLIWSMIGGEQRVAVGLADTLVEDDTDQVRDAVLAAFAAGVNKSNRTEQVDAQLERLGRIDPAAIDPVVLRSLWQGNA